MPWKVVFFQTARGDYPVKEFIEKQDEATYAKALHLIRLLANSGPFLTPPYCKKIKPALFELRSSGKNALRILYTKQDDTYHLLHAFQKKTKKSPVRELEIALDRMKRII